MCSALGVCRGGLRVLVILSVVVAAAGAETRRVPAGGNLQQALDAAQPGDVVLLAAGATFTGSFVLRKKTGDGFVTVQTEVEETGPFGTLVLMGYDWDDKEAWVHSLRLFARELMPALNKAVCGTTSSVCCSALPSPSRMISPYPLKLGPNCSSWMRQ